MLCQIYTNKDFFFRKISTGSSTLKVTMWKKKRKAKVHANHFTYNQRCTCLRGHLSLPLWVMSAATEKAADRGCGQRDWFRGFMIYSPGNDGKVARRENVGCEQISQNIVNCHLWPRPSPFNLTKHVYIKQPKTSSVETVAGSRTEMFQALNYKIRLDQTIRTLDFYTSSVHSGVWYAIIFSICLLS